MINTAVDHSSLALILEQLDIDRGPSEVHGFLCGLLCTMKSDKAKVKWFSDLLKSLREQPEKVEALADEIRQLDALFGHTLEQLNGALFEFQLLLPPDTESATSSGESEDAIDIQSLELRTQALAQWCSGYAFGFGSGDQARSDTALPEDTRELLQDIQEIARTETSVFAESPAAPDQSVDEDSGEINLEQTEQDLSELEEYVRVGVLVINEELQPVIGKPKTGSAPVLH